ncbi:MAG: methyltransferase domain-containing protein [Mariprofundaceae bacterium]|nr:methyltransferase domain-containing protein [Mariprofundaceae bacterium]
MFNFYKRFLDGMPFYLARHYWWAYLWKTGVWFFDHQLIINAILFGQYKKLMEITLARLGDGRTGRTLQMTCVYGHLTPGLLNHCILSRLHIFDVAQVQLELARRKSSPGNTLIAVRMNAERLGYCDHAFDTVILFFLLHEMPYEARQQAMSEAVRIMSPGGRLIVTEYAPLPERHILYRFPPFRWLLTTLEPFLGDFWREDLTRHFNALAARHKKKILETWHVDIFHHFYRVREFRVIAATNIERHTDEEN